MLLPEIPPEICASTLLGLRVLGNHREPARALMTKSRELRDELAGAGSKALGRYRDSDAALLIAFDEAGFFQIGKECVTNPWRHAR